MTAAHLAELRTDIDASENVMDKIQRKIRKCIGIKAIAKYAPRDLKKYGRRLEDFYTSERIPMEVKKKIVTETKRKGTAGATKSSGKGKAMTKTITITKEKDVIYPKDTAALLQYLMDYRGFDPAYTEIGIGADDGQSIFKFTVIMYDRRELVDGDDNVDDEVPGLVNGIDDDNDDDDDDDDDNGGGGGGGGGGGEDDNDDDDDDDDDDDNNGKKENEKKRTKKRGKKQKKLKKTTKNNKDFIDITFIVASAIATATAIIIFMGKTADRPSAPSDYSWKNCCYCCCCCCSLLSHKTP